MPCMRLSLVSQAVLLAALSMLGCGGGHDEVKKQISALEAEIAKLKASEAALADRLERAEIGLRAQKKASEPGGPGLAATGRGEARQRDGDRPELDVVRLSPAADPDDPDADTPRPILRASGDSGVIQERPAGKILDDRKESGDFGKKKPFTGSAAKKLTKPAGEKKNP
jgi:hypothetical protein